MVKFVQALKKKSVSFNNIEDFKTAYGKYGNFSFNGKPIVYSVYTDDIYEAAKLKDLQGEIYVIMKPKNLEEIRRLVSDESLSDSKYNRIIDCLNTNNIYVENKRIIQLLLKVLPNYDVEDELLEFANKHNKYITIDAIKSEYIVDTGTHPINVLKSVLSNKPYKSILKNTRKQYNDKAIRTSMLNHIITSLNKRFKFSTNKEEYDTLGYFSTDKLCELYVALHMVNSIDIAIEVYKKHRKKVLYEHS